MICRKRERYFRANHKWIYRLFCRYYFFFLSHSLRLSFQLIRKYFSFHSHFESIFRGYCCCYCCFHWQNTSWLIAQSLLKMSNTNSQTHKYLNCLIVANKNRFITNKKSRAAATTHGAQHNSEIIHIWWHKSACCLIWSSVLSSTTAAVAAAGGCRVLYSFIWNMCDPVLELVSCCVSLQLISKMLTLFILVRAIFFPRFELFLLFFFRIFFYECCTYRWQVAFQNWTV